MPVYFVRSSTTGHVKIGRSQDPYGRIRSLRTAHPGPLDVLHIEWSWDAFEERHLHRRFSHLRVVGGGQEWFRGADELLAHIEELKRRASTAYQPRTEVPTAGFSRVEVPSLGSSLFSALRVLACLGIAWVLLFGFGGLLLLAGRKPTGRLPAAPVEPPASNADADDRWESTPPPLPAPPSAPPSAPGAAHAPRDDERGRQILTLSRNYADNGRPEFALDRLQEGEGLDLSPSVRAELTALREELAVRVEAERRADAIIEKAEDAGRARSDHAGRRR